VVAIERIASGGEGVGRLGDGRAVFVPRTAPGDRAELRDVKLHRRFARARIARLVEASAERVEPRCPHYVRDDCGGCQLQHMAAPAQRAARSRIAGDALRRLAKLQVADPEVEPAPSDWEYRTKLTLHAEDGGRRVGLHPYDRPDRVFELDWCHITAAPLNRLWRAARAARDLLPGNLAQLVLRLDRAGGRHLVVRAPAEPAWSEGPRLHRAMRERGVEATVWWEPEGGAARAVAGAGEAFPATVFEQVHPAMGDRVRACAIAELGDAHGRTVWDLYAGIGETTAALAAAGARVESVESDAKAVALAERRGPAARRIAARAEDAVRKLTRPDLVITNPPRVGMDERITAALVEQAPERIVYVSCDPATLARDLVRLAPRFRLASVRAFDLFPETAHVESVARLERV
jgi:23S rRNA (uracil1939-C5)-methyltransferase